jgi:saccharopine dehydrogenase-like NADP-dependent oxidoreductase
MKIAVLGAGLVGRPMAVDLSRDERFDVLAVDVSEPALARLRKWNPDITTVRRDLSDPREVADVVSRVDMVVSSVPGRMGFATLGAIIEAGKDVVDIAFFPEDPFELGELAEQKSVTAIVDCGVAPGMSNLLVGHADHHLDETDEVLIYVGGLPQTRVWPYEYKASFSPADVIEEYTRPARYVENGAVVVRPALSDPEIIDLPRIGSLEAFNTDGLRTLMTTIDAPNMKEKTLRYGGHVEKMAMLRSTGFFDKEEVEVGGVRVRPLDLTSRLLFRCWELADDEADLTVMRVIVGGRRGGERMRYTYDLFDRHDPVTGVHSMARTTGYTATVVARVLADGLFTSKGLIVPERIGRDDACVEFILRELRERGVVYEERIDRLAA